MRGKGITYDTGFVLNGVNSRRRFDPGQVERELRIIRDDLHCTAVRITGGDPERIERAAAYAVGLGLEVWFSPYPLELGADEMLAMFADCAERAERLRVGGGENGGGGDGGDGGGGGGGEIVFVTGAELSLMSRDFLPGANLGERVALLRGSGLAGEVGPKVNAFLARAVEVVRERFGGRVTYASVPIDRVDWTPFDFVAVDLYRSAEIAGRFADGVRALVAQRKPVAVTEFGSAGYRGAGDRGALGLEIVEYGVAGPVRLNGVYERDEEGQAAYLRESLEVFDAAGVDTAFVFLFALTDHPHRPDGDPRDDLDLASYGIVKVYEDRTGESYPDMPWEPKVAFSVLGAYYAAG